MDIDPGWTTEGLWAFGQPSGNGGQQGQPDPTSGYTGSNVYGYNLNGDYENYLSQKHLTSTALDCTNLIDVTLKFRRWLGVEQAPFDHAYLRVSTDGSTWTTIWENGGTIADSAWTLCEYDISSPADGQPTVYLRWTMGATDGSGQYCGWNLDDVEVWAIGTKQPGQITASTSCLTHDAAGEFCIDLDAVNIEPRQPGAQKIRFEVSEAATAVDATVNCTPDTYTGTINVTADGGTTVTVEFDPALPNQNCCQITLSGDADASFAVRTLAGDASRSGEVDTTDASQTKLRFGATLDAGNAMFDYNCSGSIDTTDFSQIKLHFDSVAPPCP